MYFVTMSFAHANDVSFAYANDHVFVHANTLFFKKTLGIACQVTDPQIFSEKILELCF